MNELPPVIEGHGLLLVFLNVFFEQLGLPIPAYPTLIVTGSLATQSQPLLAGGMLLALLACFIADSLWYLAGRHYGGALLRMICRISLSQDTCIRQGLHVYQRVGPRALLVSKFLPGAGALVTSVAGMSGTPYRTFAWYSIAGSFIWAGSAMLLGMIFSDAITPVLEWLSRYALLAVGIVLGALSGFIAWKYLQRIRLLRRTARVPRISVEQLMALRDTDDPPVILDVRSGLPEDAGIPGAIMVSLEEPLDSLVEQLKGSQVVIYCACPNELSAALLVERLNALGITRGKALAGGLDAWVGH